MSRTSVAREFKQHQRMVRRRVQEHRLRLLDPLTRLKKAQELPPGHVERRKAREQVDKVYEACHRQMRAWERTLKRKYRKYRWFKKVEDGKAFCDFICDEVGQKHIKCIVPSSPDLRYGAGAHYHKGEIHFCSSYMSLSTMIHELVHHCGCFGHGKDFCEIQELLCEATERWLEFRWKQDNCPWELE